MKRVNWKDVKALTRLVQQSKTYTEVLGRLGLRNVGNNHKTLKRHLLKNNIDTQHFVPRHTAMNKKRRRLTVEEAFCTNSKANNGQLKRLIKTHSLLEYKCVGCDNEGVWRDRLSVNERLVLQLDHKNGINNDCRLDNLQFLCPNCHSKTQNFAGRNTNPLTTRAGRTEHFGIYDRTTGERIAGESEHAEYATSSQRDKRIETAKEHFESKYAKQGLVVDVRWEDFDCDMMDAEYGVEIESVALTVNV